MFNATHTKACKQPNSHHIFPKNPHLDFGLVRTLNLLLHQLVEVQGSEELVLLDGLEVVGPGTQALLGVTVQQRHDEALAWVAEEGREAQNAVLDLVVHLVDVVGIEGRDAHSELVEKNAQTPPVHGLAVTSTSHNFRCYPNRTHIRNRTLKRNVRCAVRTQVLWGTAERVCLVVGVNVLGQTEICEANVSVLIEKNVLGLEVSVDNVERVQMTESKTDFSHVQTCDNNTKAFMRTRLAPTPPRPSKKG